MPLSSSAVCKLIENRRARRSRRASVTAVVMLAPVRAAYSQFSRPPPSQGPAPESRTTYRWPIVNRPLSGPNVTLQRNRRPAASLTLERLIRMRDMPAQHQEGRLQMFLERVRRTIAIVGTHQAQDRIVFIPTGFGNSTPANRPAP